MIKDNIPIKYWSDLEQHSLINFVNFDHRPYRGKLIKNLQDVKHDDVFHTFQTSFQANNQTYNVNIETYEEEEDIPETIDNLVKLFEQQKAYIPFRSGEDENTLYLDEDYEGDYEKKLFK